MNIDEFVSEYLLRWSQDSDLGRHAAVVKHSGFKNENEFRIVSHVPEGETVNMTFSQKRSIMARHYALFFPSDLSKEKDPLKGSLPIQEVMIGPSRHQKISEQGVRDLLLCCGYQNVTMSCSKVPYQQI